MPKKSYSLSDHINHLETTIARFQKTNEAFLGSDGISERFLKENRMFINKANWILKGLKFSITNQKETKQ